jgi:hypothetical protein
MPVAPDLPMIEIILVEVPSPSHPYGVRMVDLPMSPPRLSEALDAATPRMAAEQPGAFRPHKRM